MQQDLTLITPIAGGWEALAAELRNRGDQLQAGWDNDAPAALDAVTQLHFLSLFVIEPQGENPALLVLEASFDGSRDAFLDRLVQTNAALLQAVYASCVGYPAGATDEQLRAYLGKQKHCNQLFFVGCPGLTTGRIAEDREIAEEVAGVIRALNPPIGRRAQIVREVWQRLSRGNRARVLSTPKRPFWVRQPLLERPLPTLYWYAKWPLAIGGWLVLALVLIEYWKPGLLPGWIAPPAPVLEATWCWTLFFLACAGVLTFIWALIWWSEFPSRLSWRMARDVIFAKLEEYVRTSLLALPSFGALLGLLALAHWQWGLLWKLILLGLVVLLFGALVAAIVWYVRLLRIGLREPGDTVYDLRWDPARLTQLREREDRLAQTHLVSVTSIRPGWLRMATLRCVLFLIHWLARIFYNPLGLFSTQSIHFARWTIIDEGRRLVFISNYGGSFGGYLGVFATLGATGVSAIWNNTEGFPRGFILLLDGARDEQRFKARARDSQVETLFWYRRYPRLSVAAIERNAAIRMELQRFSREGFRIAEAELDVFLRRFAATTP